MKQQSAEGQEKCGKLDTVVTHNKYWYGSSMCRYPSTRGSGKLRLHGENIKNNWTTREMEQKAKNLKTLWLFFLGHVNWFLTTLMYLYVNNVYLISLWWCTPCPQICDIYINFWQNINNMTCFESVKIVIAVPWHWIRDLHVKGRPS